MPASCESCACHVGEPPDTPERAWPLAVGEEAAAAVVGKGWWEAEWLRYFCHCHRKLWSMDKPHPLELLGKENVVGN